jgi:hypothetical protein
MSTNAINDTRNKIKFPMMMTVPSIPALAKVPRLSRKRNKKLEAIQK